MFGRQSVHSLQIFLKHYHDVTAREIKLVLPKVIADERVDVPIGYNGKPQNSLLLRRSPPPSNIPIPRSTPLTTHNGTRIQSAVLPQHTFRTYRQRDRSTHGISDRSIPRALTLYYTDSKRRAEKNSFGKDARGGRAFAAT